MLKKISSPSIKIFLKCNRYRSDNAVILTSFLQYCLYSSRYCLSHVSSYCFHNFSASSQDSKFLPLQINVSATLFSFNLFQVRFRINIKISMVLLFNISISDCHKPTLYIQTGLSNQILLNHTIYQSNSNNFFTNCDRCSWSMYS
ncbi:MAG: hypothetical protein WCG25_05055 [bacterium]